MSQPRIPFRSNHEQVGCQTHLSLSLAFARQGACISSRSVEIVGADAKRLISPLSVPCSRRTPSADHDGVGEEEDFRMRMQVNTKEHATLSLLLSCEAIAARVNELAI